MLNICVYASQDRPKPIAIVIPNPALLQKLAESVEVLNKSYEQLVQDPKIKSLVLRDLQAVGKKAGLAPFEIVEAIVLTDEEWSSHNVSLRLIKRNLMIVDF